MLPSLNGSVICAGGPLVYDRVQLVQNSAALNGTQRVLLDHVISEKECSDLRHLAHVRTQDVKSYNSLCPRVGLLLSVMFEKKKHD